MGRLILEDQIFDKPRVPVHLKIMVEHLRRYYGLPNFLRHRASPKNVINILTNSPTVVAVINKDAKEGSNPSYIWKGMLVVQETIRKGCRRCVGDGLDTIIGSDAWLPVGDNPYIQTILHESIFYAPVASLMNEQGEYHGLVSTCELLFTVEL
nr:uncharacterized protein LOC109147770 [Ipomoea trifida]